MQRPRALYWLSLVVLAGCMNSPVLDSAKVLPHGVWRYNVNASLPLDDEPLKLEEEDSPERELTYREKWRYLSQDPVVGIAAHHGIDHGNAQIDLRLDNNLMLGFGGKFRLYDEGVLSIATGGHAHISLFNALSDELPAVVKFSLPLWVGLEPHPWLSFYLTERVQLWWVEPVGVTAAALQTAGLRIGSTFGILAEVTYILEPFYDSSGFQLAVAIYSTEPAPGTARHYE